MEISILSPVCLCTRAYFLVTLILYHKISKKSNRLYHDLFSNSACEGFFGRLKNEMFYGRSWQGVSQEEFIEELNSYIHWYNEKHIKQSLGGLSPREYRHSLGPEA